ncbi:hypothetical protein DFH09DRAFT_1411648 [Mycena vulgaris]|nr:hypothetical protein DFH09DRAFT_1411648 [Mycena vulgaris]
MAVPHSSSNLPSTSLCASSRRNPWSSARNTVMGVLLSCTQAVMSTPRSSERAMLEEGASWEDGGGLSLASPTRLRLGEGLEGWLDGPGLVLAGGGGSDDGGGLCRAGPARRRLAGAGSAVTVEKGPLGLFTVALFRSFLLSFFVPFSFLFAVSPPFEQKGAKKEREKENKKGYCERVSSQIWKKESKKETLLASYITYNIPVFRED